MFKASLREYVPIVKSLSGRLSSALTISLIIFLVIKWVIVSYAIRTLTENQVADRLIKDGENILAGIRFDRDGSFKLDARRINTVYQRPFSGHYFVVIVGEEKFISRSLWDHDITIPTLAPGDDMRFTTEGPVRSQLLAITHGYRKHGRDMSITVAENLDPLNVELRRFQWVYGGVSLIAIVLLLLIQYWIVRRELKPLKMLRENMLRLERGETDRVDAVGPAEIAPVIVELNRLLATMGKKARRSREALGNLAHALKTRLAILNQVANQTELSALPEVRQTLQQTSEGMRHIVERELKRARLIGDALPGQRVNLNLEIATLVKTLQLMYADKSLDVGYTISNDAQFVGDQEDLLEMLGNLLDNACKWCRHQVLLKVDAKDGVVFLIADDGDGCPPTEIERLTIRGFRADETQPGSGLGLAIVRDIVESYGGRLTIGRSAELGGLQVEVWIPNR